MNARVPLPADGARRAALALHALAPADRAWMLERLPRERRGEVEALLAELEALGIPRDRSLVEAIAQKAPADASRPVPPPTAARIAKALEGEPAGLVALASRAHDETRQGSVPPALREALVQEVAARLFAANEPGASAAKPLLRRWQAGWLRIARKVA